MPILPNDLGTSESVQTFLARMKVICMEAIWYICMELSDTNSRHSEHIIRILCHLFYIMAFDHNRAIGRVLFLQAWGPIVIIVITRLWSMFTLTDRLTNLLNSFDRVCRYSHGQLWYIIGRVRFACELLSIIELDQRVEQQRTYSIDVV